jgi:hypothetical protein
MNPGQRYSRDRIMSLVEVPRNNLYDGRQDAHTAGGA